MDKYEFNIKVDQIKKLAAKKSFQEAAAIGQGNELAEGEGLVHAGNCY